MPVNSVQNFFCPFDRWPPVNINFELFIGYKQA